MEVSKLLGKLKHSKWNWLMPLLLIFIATFSGSIVRAICLIAALSISVWVFYDTELAKGHVDAPHSKRKRVGRTGLAAFIMALVALVIFWSANRVETMAQLDHPKPSAQNNPKNPEPIPSPVVQPEVKPIPQAKPVKRSPNNVVKSGNIATKSVTNSPGSIINQDSKIEAPQTVNNINQNRDIPETSLAAFIPVVSVSPSKAWISCFQGDAEQQNLAVRLRNVLNQGAKWNAELGVAHLTLGDTIQGIEVEVRDTTNPSQSALNLVSALNSMTPPLDAHIGPWRGDPPIDVPIHIVIGLRH